MLALFMLLKCIVKYFNGKTKPNHSNTYTAIAIRTHKPTLVCMCVGEKFPSPLVPLQSTRRGGRVSSTHIHTQIKPYARECV